jgi:hypothetical protein
MSDDNEELFNQLEDPKTGHLDSHALSLHELYSAYARAGFTDDQAHGLCVAIVSKGSTPEADEGFDYGS